MSEEKTTKEPVSVPFIVHESALARVNIMNQRLWKATAVAFAALIATNAAWIAAGRRNR